VTAVQRFVTSSLASPTADGVLPDSLRIKFVHVGSHRPMAS
jgi:hypothetical protein